MLAIAWILFPIGIGLAPGATILPNTFIGRNYQWVDGQALVHRGQFACLNLVGKNWSFMVGNSGRIGGFCRYIGRYDWGSWFRRDGRSSRLGWSIRSCNWLDSGWSGG